MSLRALFRLDPALPRRRWQIPIVLPALLALALVVVLAVQSVRAVQVHRRAVSLALRDYAAFATWQYTRRASDYLRLGIITTLTDGARAAAPSQARLRNEGFAVGVVRGDRLEIQRNDTKSPSSEVADAFAAALAHARRSKIRFGLTPLGDPKQHRYLGYVFRGDSTGLPDAGQGLIIDEKALLPIFDHVASFAPLLPKSFVGDLPNDSLVSVKILGADGTPIAVIGRDVDGITANDVLGPDLGEVRVVATLHPIATQRLVAGGMPSSGTFALIAMLGVTIVLVAVAVLQMRRTAELIRLRDDFVASVSHELKTPLTQISLFADTLSQPRERSTSEQRQYLTIISREATRLGQLVDGILHFAGMMRSATVAPSREASLLGEEIRAAVAAFEPIADARAVTIHMRIDGEIELPLDRDAFRQLMLNLLDNAIKFGPEGGQILITAIGGERRATIWVDDEGPGVPAAERERIFEAFVRAGNGASKVGSGIGLAVVRNVARSHGGLVRMIESPTGGARVEVQLPAVRVVTSEYLTTLA